MKSKFCTLILAGSLFGAITAWAAAPETILRSAWKDPRLALHQESVEITTDAQSWNPLEKTQLRLDLGQLTQEDVKVGVRLFPRGYTEYKTTAAFQEALLRNEKLAQKEVLSRLLVSRYDLLARLQLVQEKKKLSAELQKINRRAKRASSLVARNDRTELKGYLKAQADLNQLDLKLAEIDRDEKNLRDELKSLGLANPETFDLSDLAQIEDLQQQIERLQVPEQTKSTLSAELAQKDLEKSRAGMAYERARDDKWVDHVEISVKDDRNEKVYGVSAAFNLPFAGAPDLSRVDDELNELRNRSKAIETLKTSEREFRNSLMELQTLISLHRSMKTAQNRMSADQLRRASQSISSSDPLLALELQRGWFEGREQLLDIEYRIRSLYVLSLHESSVLAETPEKNYLSKTERGIP